MKSPRFIYLITLAVAVFLFSAAVYVAFQSSIEYALLPNSPDTLEQHILTSLSPEDLPHLEPRTLEHYISVLGFIQTVEILNTIDPATCHDAAHIIGDLAYKETTSIAGSFNLCTEKCMSGCIHGTLLAAVNSHVDYTDGQHEHVSLEEFASDLPSICEVETADPTLEGTCIHGVGHALMSLSVSLDTGLALCDGYTDERKRYYCETGVFMEALLGEYNRYASSTNPLHPCDKYGTHPAACMRYQTDIITHNFEPNIVPFCQNLNEPGLQSACFHGLGRSLALEVYNGDTGIRTCLESELSAAQVSCVEGIAEVLHEYDQTIGGEICSDLSPEPHLETICRTALNHGLYSLEKDFSPYIGEEITQQ